MKPTPINKEALTHHLRLLLQPYWNDKKATPDLSWVWPDVERILIEALLIDTYGNQSQVARLTGLNRATVRKLAKPSRQKNPSPEN
ncbi:helix-turn-helix domain-containing protein [Vibrio sp. ER1A]|uniref:helix-turn-helix domain-containing protein n=1 Tax=Vibrio sp. ER1A TaxID=1517681 RepID=UPI0004DD77EA|nr:helix-turn-helix domain-containing protein [Vibrio sp. ER1A]KFA99676.1 hypothetical protein HW45_01775 [Vibrio sp. ER1A]